MAKTFENVKMPADIRQKMMAAVSMLLVSSIMVVSSTYAWFTLSTAPEVQNISTTVAGNGSLELALMPASGTFGEISSAAVGNDATAVAKNTHWGNLIDLSDESYGLSLVTLNPAQLNLTADGAFADATKPLAVAEYGFDGRIAQLTSNKIAVKARTASDAAFNTNAYGVRAIGETNDAGAIDLSDGKLASYGYVVDLAVRLNAENASGSTNTPGKLLLQTDEKQRIYNGDDASTNTETLGGGSYMVFKSNETTLSTAGTTGLLQALRVTFVQNYGNAGANSYTILGTARLDTSEGTLSTEGNKYPLYLYQDTTKLEGADAVLLNSLPKNTAQQISAIVWLDGSQVKNANVAADALTSMAGKLNLQFTTDVELKPAVNTSLKGE